MMEQSRRTLFRLAAATPLLAMPFIAKPARAAQFKLKLANGQPLAHPLSMYAAKAVKRVNEEAKGRIDFQYFPNSQLGGDMALLPQLRSGAIDFYATTGVLLGMMAPTPPISGVGFAFSNYRQVWRAMDGDLGTIIRKAIEKIGMRPFEKAWDNGFREITSSIAPVRTPDDLKGMKIRVAATPLYTEMFKKLGASPTSIDLSEAYSALQTHIVDGQENPLSLIAASKFYEVQKYCSMTNHAWDGMWIVGNPRSWNALPPDLQQIIDAAFNDMALQQRAYSEHLNETLRTDLQSKGLAFNDPDQNAFREALRRSGFFEEEKARFGNEVWSVLQKYAGGLA